MMEEEEQQRWQWRRPLIFNSADVGIVIQTTAYFFASVVLRLWACPPRPPSCSQRGWRRPPWGGNTCHAPSGTLGALARGDALAVVADDGLHHPAAPNGGPLCTDARGVHSDW